MAIPFDLSGMWRKVQGWSAMRWTPWSTTTPPWPTRSVRDDEVDHMKRENRLKAEEMIRVDPERTSAMLTLMAASRNLERIADHATNSRGVSFGMTGILWDRGTYRYCVNVMLLYFSKRDRHGFLPCGCRPQPKRNGKKRITTHKVSNGWSHINSVVRVSNRGEEVLTVNRLANCTIRNFTVPALFLVAGIGFLAIQPFTASPGRRTTTLPAMWTRAGSLRATTVPGRRPGSPPTAQAMLP